MGSRQISDDIVCVLCGVEGKGSGGRLEEWKVGAGTWAFQNKWIDAPTWMVAVGMGLYFGYIQFNSIFFDRLIATFKYVSTVGFLIYLADSFGYVGSVGVMLYKEFGHASLSWLGFFTQSSYILSITGSVLMALSLVYFITKFARQKKTLD